MPVTVKLQTEAPGVYCNIPIPLGVRIAFETPLRFHLYLFPFKEPQLYRYIYVHQLISQSLRHPFLGIDHRHDSARHSGSEPISPTVSRFNRFFLHLLPDRGAKCFSVVLFSFNHLDSRACRVMLSTGLRRV